MYWRNRCVERTRVDSFITGAPSASGDEQCLPGTHLDGLVVIRPGKYALDALESFLVGVVLVGKGRQLLPGGGANLEHRYVAVGIIPRQEDGYDRSDLPSRP